MFVNPALPQPAPTLVESFDLIIAGLCQAMAEQCGIDSFIAPLCVLVCVRLLRTATRFQLLFDRWREGRLPAARPPASHPPGSGRRPLRRRPKWAAAASEPERTLPRGFAWLLKFVPSASIYGAQLQHLLTNPEMAAFLAAAPQAGRLLRPLCRTLGVNPIPQMLRPRNPKPATPAPEGTSPEKPPTTETTANKARPEIATTADPGAPPSHAPSLRENDPRWARPVSLWCQPPRPRH